jgi:hypothetical protein
VKQTKGNATMAQKLLSKQTMKSMLIISTLISGCVFLSPIDDSSVQNQEENNAPTLDIDSVFPRLDTFPSVNMAQPSSVSFSLPTIEDPNTDDTLTVRFYADGQSDFIENRIINPSGFLVRSGVINFVLDENKLVAFQDENGNLFGTHRLEVIISDNGFVADAGEGARQIPEGGRQNYYFWELEF